jgi:hypothetical protein
VGELDKPRIGRLEGSDSDDLRAGNGRGSRRGRSSAEERDDDNAFWAESLGDEGAEWIIGVEGSVVGVDERECME